MLNSNQFFQNVSQRLAANSYAPLAPQTYQPLGFKFGVRRSGFELSKFGVCERFFLFAEIPNLDATVLQSYSAGAFQFANKNKSTPLPNGLFSCVFCFAVVVTENLDPQLAQAIRDSSPIKHWSAFEMPVVYDVANGGLYYFEKTPVWGAAYYAGFRQEVKNNLG